MSRLYDALKYGNRIPEPPEDQAQSNADSPPPPPRLSEVSAIARPEASAVARPEEPAVARLRDDPHLRALPPLDDKEGPARVVGAGLHSRAGDEFHVLASHVQSFANDENRRVVMIGSATSGEGKSFVSVNLAVTLARWGRRVLLVDADLRNPSLHRTFNLSPLHGLASYVLDHDPLESCVYPTDVPGLDLAPAGKSGSLAGGEIFGSTRVRQFILDVVAANRWDHVIIDTPPVLAASETQIIARLADGLLMVVAANQTPRNAVARSLELLKAVPLLGLVFNQFEPPLSHRMEYGYGYGHPYRAKGST